jgi:plastocyanin
MRALMHGTMTRRWLSSRRVFGACVWLWLACISIFACKPKEPFGIRPGTVFVAARDSFFTPDTIRVGVGFPVRWTNEGAAFHSVDSDSGLWASGLLQTNAWFEVKFDSAGTFPYHCSQHSAMVGAVIAEP